MVMMQPFVLFSGPGSLEYLRNYGFKTFNDVWDESYDLETDHKKRYQILIDLIYDLSTRTNDQLQSMMEKIRPIVEHNRQHFYSEYFEKQLLDELHGNMEECLRRQKEKTTLMPGGSWLYVQDKLIDRGVPIPDVKRKRLQESIEFIKTTDPDLLSTMVIRYPWLNSLV